MRILLFLLCMLPLVCIAQKEGRFESLEAAMENPELVIELELWGFDQVYTELPENIDQLIHVKSIILRGNDLRTLPQSFRNLTTLEELSLGQNPHLAVGEVCEILSALPNLKSLDLESTGLDEVPDEVRLLRNLKELYLGLNDLPRSEFEKLEKALPGVTIHD